MRTLLALAVLLLAAPATSPRAQGSAADYRADVTRSTVRFKAVVNQAFIREVKGTLRRFSFDGRIDAGSPEVSRARVVISMDSVTSDTFGVSDSLLRDKLKTAQYPTSTIDVTAVRRGPAADQYDVDVDVKAQDRDLKGTVRVKTVRFPDHLRLLGTYVMPKDAQGRWGEIEFSLRLEAR